MERTVPAHPPWPATWRIVAIVAAVAGVAALAVVARSPGAAGATGTGVVTGTVWYDVDSDGIRDPGEPGVRYVTIARVGTGITTTTDRNGNWSLRLPSGPATISALTGWLPSACPGDLYCAAGRTPDQRFAVENQFVRARVSVVADGTVNRVDLGLEPDYGDPTGSPTSLHRGNDHGDGRPNVHDLAVRHSNIGWYKGCTDPNHTRVCPVGTRIDNLGQIYNQGTAWVTGVRFVLTVPPGTSLIAEPRLEAETPGTQPWRTGRTGRTADGSTWIEYQLGAALPPAGAVWFRSSYRIVAGPASPPPLGIGSKADRQGYVSISAVTPAEDDSPLRVDPRLGRDKGHTVNAPTWQDDDTSDAIEFNVG